MMGDGDECWSRKKCERDVVTKLAKLTSNANASGVRLTVCLATVFTNSRHVRMLAEECHKNADDVSKLPILTSFFKA